MYRQSPYYYENRHQAFKQINNYLAQELEQLKISEGTENLSTGIIKKSVTKQEFISYFNKKPKQENLQMEEEPLKYCKNCTKSITNNDYNCIECSRPFCQNCIHCCYYCGQQCCIFCSNRIYLNSGDFIICLHCSQNQ